LFFKKMLNNIFNIKSSGSKLVSSRRSTVLSLPLQLGFPAAPQLERHGSIKSMSFA